MDELTRLNRLIRQFQTLSHSTPDPEQRVRVEGEIRELQSYRERIAAEGPKGPGPKRGAWEVPCAEFPVLCRLAASAQSPGAGAVQGHGCPFQETIHQLSLYTQHFAREYLPLFEARRTDLDARSAQRGEDLRMAFHDLEGNVGRFLHDCTRLVADGTGVEAEGETRTRHVALARRIETDAAAFFRSVESYCDSLSGEASTLREAIAEMEDFTSEAVAFLDVPETNTQENRRADRH